MKTIVLCSGVSLSASLSTIARVEREQREDAKARARRERVEARERELRDWLRTHDRSDELYSDIYKYLYGVRPRW